MTRRLLRWGRSFKYVVNWHDLKTQNVILVAQTNPCLFTVFTAAWTAGQPGPSLLHHRPSSFDRWTLPTAHSFLRARAIDQLLTIRGESRRPIICPSAGRRLTVDAHLRYWLLTFRGCFSPQNISTGQGRTKTSFPSTNECIFRLLGIIFDIADRVGSVEQLFRNQGQSSYRIPCTWICTRTGQTASCWLHKRH